MNKKLAQLLLFSVLGTATLSAQTLKEQFKDSSPQKSPTAVVQKSESVIKLNPASKYNLKTPEEVAKAVSKRSNANGQTTVKHQAKREASKTVHRIDAQQNVADSLVLYGVMKQTDGATTLTASHLYSFNAAPVQNYVEEAKKKALPEATAYCYAKGNYYLFSVGSVTIVDAITGETLQTDTFKLNGSAVTPMQAATYDPLTDLIYVVYWGENWSKAILTFNTETHEVNEFSNEGNKYIMSIAASPDSNLYFISYPANLYKLNKETKEETLINSKARTGKAYQNATASQSMAFDWATNKIYLANLTSDWQTHLDCLDPTTGTGYNVFDFPARERFVGLYIPYYNEGAPAAPSNISFDYSAQGNLDGQLKFTVPTTTYRNGNALSGTLTAHIVLNGTDETMEVTPGQEVVLDKTLPRGNDIIEIYISNSEGDGAMRRLITFAGYDVPAAVSGLEVSVANGQATLKWNATNSSLNGGPLDDSTIGYKIVRYPDETVVAHELKNTTFIDQMPTARMHYWYDVISEAGTDEGGIATTNEVIGGTAFIPPFTEGFDTQEDFDLHKVVDNNNDQHTWYWMQSMAGAYLMGNGVTNPETGFVATFNDDYLISPNIQLKKNVDYRVTFHCGDAWVDEHMRLLLGTSQSLTGNETVIDSTIVVPSGESYEYNKIFTVPADGEYYLIFHSNTVGSSVNNELYDYSIDIEGTYAGPDSVTSARAEAGALGALTNKVYFTAPTKTYKGDELYDLTRINIFKNDTYLPVATFDNPEEGAAYTWDDPNVVQGLNTYRIVTYNAAGQGRTATVVNWTGIDVPMAPTNVKAKMDFDSYKPSFTWTAVGNVGTHGGYVDVSKVKYVVCMYNEYNWDDHWEAISDSLSATSFQYDDYSQTYSQLYQDFVVRAYNGTGFSGNGVGITLGPPYNMPYTESFAGGIINQDPWTRHAPTYYYAWEVVTGSGITVKPKDKDGGMLRFTWKNAYSPQEVLEGPRVSIKDAANPQLSFYMYHGFDVEPGELTLDVYTNVDDAGFQKVATVDYNNGEEGWMRYALALPTGAHNVQVALAANAQDASASIFLDRLQIAEGVNTDLSIDEFNSVKRATANSDVNINVRVSNNGVETAKNFNVVLLKDSTVEVSSTVDQLEPNQVKDLVFTLHPTVSDKGKTYQLRAYVSCDGDAEAANDSSAVRRLTIEGSIAPAATYLTGSESGADVHLSWTAPTSTEMADAVTDDFEDYEPFIIDSIGDWTTYDGDGLVPVYFNGPSIPHAFEPQAWQVWNPEQAGFSIDKFDVLEAHSGNQYLACWAASDAQTTTLTNDDWLISSKVAGGSNVDFWLRVPNDGSGAQVIEMLASNKDSINIETINDDFIAFDRDSVEGTTEWVHFTYTLPQDAKFFAVRCCTYESHTVLFLDDITYTPLYGSTSELTFNGYNVYRDGSLIGNTMSTEYIDEGAATSEHTYVVTVNWKESESDPTNSYVNNVYNGVGEVSAVATASAFGGNHCIRILNAGGTDISIYTAGGALVYNGRVAGNKTVSVGSGIYVVRMDSKAAKVVVR